MNPEPDDNGDADWVAEQEAALFGGDPAAAEGAARELGKLGPLGESALLAAARHAVAGLRAIAAVGLGWGAGRRSAGARGALVDLLADPDLDVRAEACKGLPALGSGAIDRRAVEGLARTLDDAAEAGHVNAAACAIQALAGIGPPAGDASTALVRFLRRPPIAGSAGGRALRLWAVEALGLVRSCRAEEVGELERALGEVPATAATALAAYGSRARGLATRLRARLDDPDAEVRLACAGTLARIDPCERSARILVDAAVDGDRETRLAAMDALGAARAVPPALLERLRARLDDPDTGVAGFETSVDWHERFEAEQPGGPDEVELRAMRRLHLRYVRGFGPLATGAAPRVRAWMRDPDPWLRIDAAAALARIDPGDDALETLESLLDDDRPQVRRGAILAVDEFAAVPGRTRDALRARLDDPDPGVARTAAFVLGELADRDGAGPAAAR